MAGASEPLAAGNDPVAVAVADVLARVDASPVTLGDGWLVCVDGPAGSGKTTLAEALRAAARRPTTVVHMDDLYEGWSGLAAAPERVRSCIVRPLADGRPATYRRYDWETGRWAEQHRIEPGGLLVLEGCGSGSASYADHVTVLAWVETSGRERLRRGIERDGAAMRERWLAWQRDEEALFARERTRQRADVVLGT